MESSICRCGCPAIVHVPMLCHLMAECPSLLSWQNGPPTSQDVIHCNTVVLLLSELLCTDRFFEAPDAHLQNEEKRAGAQQLDVDNGGDDLAAEAAERGFADVLVADHRRRRAIALRLYPLGHQVVALHKRLACSGND